MPATMITGYARRRVGYRNDVAEAVNGTRKLIGV